MPRLLICSVGTSLLTNPDRPWAPWRRETSLPDVGVVADWLRDMDAAVVSAETNTLRALDVTKADEVLFLVSHTPEGEFCGEQLTAFCATRYRAKGACKTVDSLAYDHVRAVNGGLKRLVEIAAAAVQDARNRALQPVFCATGGFKAEIALLSVLGALLQVEIYYIHEQYREAVRLPSLPLTWDAAFVKEREDFFQWIDSEPRPSIEVEQRLNARPELRPLIEDSADGFSYLNAAGNLIFEAARASTGRQPGPHWPDAVLKEPKEKNGVSGVPHHRDAGWEKFVNRLCQIDCVERVRYDSAARQGPRVQTGDADCGEIFVRFGDGQGALPLLVSTTARGTAQTELVADYLRNRL